MKCSLEKKIYKSQLFEKKRDCHVLWFISSSLLQIFWDLHPNFIWNFDLMTFQILVIKTLQTLGHKHPRIVMTFEGEEESGSVYYMTYV